MATSFRLHLTVATNEDFRHAFSLADDTGTAVDLTGAALAMDVAKDETTVLSLSTANGRIAIVDAPAGTFELAVPRATLATLSPQVYRHDLLLTQAGETHRIWDGALTLERGVTA